MSDSSSLFLGRFISVVFGILAVLMVIGVIRVIILTNTPPPPGVIDPAILEAQAEAAAAEAAAAEAAAAEAAAQPIEADNSNEGESDTPASGEEAPPPGEEAEPASEAPASP